MRSLGVRSAFHALEFAAVLTASLRDKLVLLLPVRNDCPCGSTIGPTISALTGIRTVDIGMPQLSMHR